MKMEDNHQTDYQEGSVILNINVTKLANGQFKASADGFDLSVSNHSQQAAVLALQDQLQDGLLKGTIRPEM